MTSDGFLRSSFVALEVNEDFSEAVVVLRDGSRVRFCHRVGKRWARAEGSDGLAGTVLAAVALFRLNPKHLDVQFTDGSRWEARFPGLPGLPPRA
jgi:hypothetical protein